VYTNCSYIGIHHGMNLDGELYANGKRWFYLFRTSKVYNDSVRALYFTWEITAMMKRNMLENPRLACFVE